eukprot:TRINITY_DN7390_c0_g1_i1.p1 TRINITY_DN7390_c0_g1~~TRINITY_DN7390_c0_g1_i1.p1  ORF type:complete len:292 (+),score=120.91 TRINITY_DN7390_c0_g1_i1:58-933(+)
MKTVLGLLALCATASASIVDAKCTPGLTPALGSLSGTALVITTSHSKLGAQNCTTCKPTGVYGEELTAPYLLFRDAGLKVTVATVAGGDVPIDPTYNNSLMITSWDQRFFADAQAYVDSHNTPSVADLDFAKYDIVYMAGGWGAAWDLGTSDALAAGISKAFAAGKLLGSMCHGALGFIKAVAPNGEPLCKGKKMTGVTDSQIEQLGIAKLTPLHPEDALKAAGADYQCKHGLLTDLFENDVVVDGTLVTGQNQMAGCQVPQQMMKLHAARLGVEAQAYGEAAALIDAFSP